MITVPSTLPIWVSFSTSPCISDWGFFSSFIALSSHWLDCNVAIDVPDLNQLLNIAMDRGLEQGIGAGCVSLFQKCGQLFSQLRIGRNAALKLKPKCRLGVRILWRSFQSFDYGSRLCARTQLRPNHLKNLGAFFPRRFSCRVSESLATFLKK